jgi:hypothetical protein
MASACARIPQHAGSAGNRETYYFASLHKAAVSSELKQVSKEARANAFAEQCECKMVKLAEGTWNELLSDELCAFRYGVHDDRVDARSATFRAPARRVTWSVARRGKLSPRQVLKLREWTNNCYQPCSGSESLGRRPGTLISRFAERSLLLASFRAWQSGWGGFVALQPSRPPCCNENRKAE